MDFSVFELDVEKTSDGSLEPSILSMFQEKTSAGEVFHVMTVFRSVVLWPTRFIFLQATVVYLLISFFHLFYCFFRCVADWMQKMKRHCCLL